MPDFSPDASGSPTRSASLDRPLRVMRIITRLNIGGPAYQAIFLTERMQDSEFETRLLIGSVGPNEGSMEPLALERRVSFHKIPGLGREISPKTDLKILFELIREIRRFRPDTVHTHLAKAGTLGRLAAAIAGVPVVVHTYHGHVFHGYFSRRKTELFLRIERFLAKKTTRIVVLGEAQEKEILGFGVGSASQMVRIPLGLELEPFLTAESHAGEFRRELGIPPDAPTVGIVARLVPIKAHEVLLQAAGEVAKRVPGARFLIVGDGDRREELETMARGLGLSVISHDRGGTSAPQTNHDVPDVRAGIVHFVGFRSDLPAVYADLDVVALCSKNEGLPVTIIEALAAARPVVSTEVGSVRDLISPEETGLLTPPGDPSALADALVRLLEDRNTALKWARSGRKHVYPRLSVDRLEGDLRRLYSVLWNEGRPQRRG